MFTLVIGFIAVVAWFYLLLGRGFFWLERPAPQVQETTRWPAVAIVVPARDEASTIGRVIETLLGQDYPGPFLLVLADDHSSDDTTARARAVAERLGRSDQFFVANAPPLPEGWSGKLWALHSGIACAAHLSPAHEYLMLADADIAHPPQNLRQLVSRAEGVGDGNQGYDLVSMMARLNCRTIVEKLTIPAFVFFFQMLYPFRWVNDPRSGTAGAAGGVMLLRRRALEDMGGLEAMRGALIDDCTLAALIKRRGRIWLGLAGDTISLRSYGNLGSIWRMIARTAFTQLRYSALILAGTVAGLFVTYLAPPLLLLGGSSYPAALGAAAWAMMSVAYWPTVRFYGLNPLWAVTLPLTALIYAGATVDSARRYWLGRGGEWKGRSQAKRKNDD